MKIQELFSSPDKWCKLTLAKDKDGQSVRYECKDAVSWCLLGAVEYCYRESGNQREIFKKIFAYLGSTAFSSISSFNDDPDTSFKDIMRLVKFLDI